MKANHVLHVLVIGVGGIGRRHIGALLKSGRCKVACFDTDSGRCRALAETMGIRDWYTSFESIPAKLFDGVVIASPTISHIQYADWCADNGLSFIIEKPLSINDDGIETVISKVRRLGLIAGVAYPRRYAKPIEELKELVSSGRIGDIKIVNSNFSQDFRKYRPDYATTYYSRLSTGGGILLDALSHHVDLVTYFAGPVKSVSAMADRFALDDCEGEDTAIMCLRFVGGALGVVQGNQFQKPNIDSIELVGTSGNLRYERISGALLWSNSDKPEWETKFVDGDWSAIFRRQAESFLDAIEHEKPLRTALEDALHTLRVVAAARESHLAARVSFL